ncbi:MAG: glycosyltransferase family 2 protein [Alteraurantiacibacter sp.]
MPRAKIKVLIVVVSYNSEEHLQRCLDSIDTELADPTIIVIDNASSDRSHEIACGHPAVDFPIRNAVNVGFSAAVNQAVSGIESDKVLLLNPDVVLFPETIDSLLALARTMPGSGIQGGRCLDFNGHLDPTSVLAAPSFWHAFAFASAISEIPVLRRFDPDSLFGWQRDGTRAVDILTGAVMLVDRALWDKLDGFDERYFLYWEDVDLCMRARRIGYRPHFTDRAVYQHVGGASSANSTERMIRILRGKVNIYRDYVPFGGLCMLGVGIWLRGRIESLMRRDTRLWRTCWERRHEWMPAN